MGAQAKAYATSGVGFSLRPPYSIRLLSDNGCTFRTAQHNRTPDHGAFETGENRRGAENAEERREIQIEDGNASP